MESQIRERLYLRFEMMHPDQMVREVADSKAVRDGEVFRGICYNPTVSQNVSYTATRAMGAAELLAFFGDLRALKAKAEGKRGVDKAAAYAWLMTRYLAEATWADLNSRTVDQIKSTASKS